MKRWTLLLAVVVLGLVGWGLRGWSQERAPWRGGAAEGDGWGERPGHPMFGRWLAMLDNDEFKADFRLSEPQAERLRQILVDTQKSTVKTRADVAVRGIELRELLRADKPDHDAVMKKLQEISSLRADLMKQHVEALLAAKTVLTPEQQKRLRSLMERQRGGMWRQRFRERGGWGGPPGDRPRPEPQSVRPGEPPVE